LDSPPGRREKMSGHTKWSDIKKPNATAEEIYEQLVKAAGMYGKAFFGHKTTKQEQKKLASLWKMALRTVAAREEAKKKIYDKVKKQNEAESGDS